MKKLLGIVLAAVVVSVGIRAISPTWAGWDDGVRVNIVTDQTYDAVGDILVGTADNTADRLAIGAAGKWLKSSGTTLEYSTATESSGALAAVTTITASTSVSVPALISASNADVTITPNGTGDIRLGLDADTALYASTTFSLDNSGNLDASGYGNFSYIKFGADPADAGAIRLSNATYILSEADAAGTDVSVIGVDSGELIQIGASGASGVTITPALTVTGGLVSPSISGHVTTTGTAPTASAGTIDTKATDHAGRIASVGATSTIVTFSAAYNATPACVATASDEPVWIVGATTAGFTITATGNIDDANYVCFEML